MWWIPAAICMTAPPTVTCPTDKEALGKFLRENSPLSLLGYRVGRSGRPDEWRKEFLQAFDLPEWVELMFGGEWGAPGSRKRLTKVERHISGMCALLVSQNSRDYSLAIEHYQSDLKWIRGELNRSG